MRVFLLIVSCFQHQVNHVNHANMSSGSVHSIRGPLSCWMQQMLITLATAANPADGCCNGDVILLKSNLSNKYSNLEVPQ